MANYKIFPLRLSDEDREAMEAHRIRLGLRSGAETIRALLLAKPFPTLGEIRDMTISGLVKAPTPSGRDNEAHLVRLLSRKAFNPQPKPKKK